MQIVNSIKTLPWHPTKRWSKRKVENITTVVVHQAASRATGPEPINKYHITPTSDRDKDGTIEGWEKNHISPTGAPHICYHFAISKDGTVHQCNELTDITWHCKGKNTIALGILVCGYFNGPGVKQADEPSIEQLNSLKELLNTLKKQLPTVKKFIGHCEADPVNKAACPGDTVMKTLKAWRSY